MRETGPMTENRGQPMRYETRLKLEREVRKRRLRTLGYGTAILGAIIAGFLLVDLDAHETKQMVGGTVEAVQPFYAGKGTVSGLTVSVKLADGRHVTVLANSSRDPHVGDHIDITEHRHLTGRTVYTLR